MIFLSFFSFEVPISFGSERFSSPTGGVRASFCSTFLCRIISRTGIADYDKWHWGHAWFSFSSSSPAPAYSSQTSIDYFRRTSSSSSQTSSRERRIERSARTGWSSDPRHYSWKPALTGQTKSVRIRVLLLGWNWNFEFSHSSSS